MHAGDRRRARRRMNDQLGEHRIVVEPHLAPALDATIPAHTGSGRYMQVLHPSGARQKSVGGILTRDAALDGPAARRDGAEIGEFLACRDSNLPLHEVQPRHELRHGMLDLNSRVHLEEVVVAICIEQELARAGVRVSCGSGDGNRRGPHARAQLRRDGDAWRLLDHLLVTALHRALAFAEREAGAVLVGEDLDLDVAWALDVLLDVHRIVTECLFRLVHGAGQRRRHLGIGAHDPHSLAAAAGSGLEQHRVAVLPGDGASFLFVAKRRCGAGHHRNSGLRCKLPRGGLAPHRRDRFGGRPDPDQPCLTHGAREPLPLRQESISGVNCLGAATFRRGDQLFSHEVALAGRRRTDVHCLVRVAHVRRLRVSVGVDRDRRDAEFLAGADNAEGDFTAIRDEDLREHSAALKLGRPVRTPSHNGILPCFLGGFRSRLPCSASSASIRRGRVSRGSMISST